jgi:SAM-dependent methyltransferase
MHSVNHTCPICQSKSSLLDVVDLNRSCGQNGEHLPLTGIPIYYVLCESCSFCWAPELYQWPLSKFEEFIYNADYLAVDPDYVSLRPKANSNMLRSMFPALHPAIRHLDYGGGSGDMSRSLSNSGWSSSSYDPFVNRNTNPAELGTFNLVTAYEVFEHVPDVDALMSDLNLMLAEDGLVIFSTLLSDGNIVQKQRLNWWYAAPRNGHISLFSKQSLALLAQKNSFNFGSFSSGLHVFFKKVPPWASHIIQAN